MTCVYCEPKSSMTIFSGMTKAGFFLLRQRKASEKCF
jgi:hypothetical protein